MAEIKEKDRVSVVEGNETFEGTVLEVKEVDCVIQFNAGDPETHKIADVTLIKSSPSKGKVSIEKQRAKLDADKAAFEQEKADLAEQQEALKEQEAVVNANIKKSITISKTKIDMTRFSKADNPVAVENETKRQEKFSEDRQANRLKKVKVAAALTPVEIRKNHLKAKLTKVRKKQYHQYTKEQIKVMAEELAFINQTPEAWTPGCVKEKKQIGAEDKLDEILG